MMNEKKPEYIIGVDLGTRKTGIVLIDSNSDIKTLWLLESNLKNEENRINEIATQIKIILQKPVFDYACVELPIYIQNFRTSLSLGGLYGVFRWLCGERHIKVIAVSNRTWKKEVCGFGGIKKEEILNYSKQRWPECDFKSQDLADAACIAEYGIQFLKEKNLINGSNAKKAS